MNPKEECGEFEGRGGGGGGGTCRARRGGGESIIEGGMNPKE